MNDETSPATPQRLVRVTGEGVQFGNAWYSHERITGCTADALNNGQAGITGNAYMEWLAAAPTPLQAGMQKSDSLHLAAPQTEAKSLQPLLIAAAEKYADNYEGQDIPARDIRASIQNAFFAGSEWSRRNRTPARQEERSSAQCPACNGYGRINDRPDARSPYGPKCPTCGGSGRVPAPAESVQGQDTDTLRTALERIAKLQHGLEMSATDEDRANYWSRVAQGYRSIAAAALRASSAPTTKG